MFPMWQMMVGVCVGLVAILVLRPRALPHDSCGGSRRRNPGNATGGDTTEPGPRFNSKPGDRCVICLNEMQNDNMTYLRCGHALHDSCYKCLKRHAEECPICRGRL